MAAKVGVGLMMIVTILAVDYGVCEGKHHAAAPAPAVDCSSLVLNMADCLTFVSAGSTVNKPEGTCCSGLKTVLQTDATCLCEAFKSSASLGVTLNVSKALTLPSVCKVSAPSAANCKLTLSPSGAPELAPTGGGAETPGGTVGSNEAAPAPAPGVSASRVLSISVGPMVLALLLALLFSGY